jgi:hypothetical protein
MREKLKIEWKCPVCAAVVCEHARVSIEAYSRTEHELRLAYDKLCDDVVRIREERDQLKEKLTDLYQRFNLGVPS